MLRGMKKDPRARFEAYVLPHLDALYRAARRLVGEASEAEDLVQETCLRAFRAIDQLRNVGSCKAWLFKILRTTYLREWGEDPYRMKSGSLDDLEPGLSDSGEILGDHYESAEVYQHLMGTDVRKAILALPPTYREVVILADIAECSYREMSQILEVPLGTVMSRLARGRRLLRESLQEYARTKRPSEEQE